MIPQAAGRNLDRLASRSAGLLVAQTMWRLKMQFESAPVNHQVSDGRVTVNQDNDLETKALTQARGEGRFRFELVPRVE